MFPCIYIAIICKQINEPDEEALFKEECRGCMYSVENYSLYVHGFWLPWLEQQRKEKKLKFGKSFYNFNFCCLGTCSFNMYGVIKYNYSGEIDNDGAATGFGIAVNDDDPSYKFIGTFLDNLPHGLSKCQLDLF